MIMKFLKREMTTDENGKTCCGRYDMTLLPKGRSATGNREGFQVLHENG